MEDKNERFTVEILLLLKDEMLLDGEVVMTEVGRCRYTHVHKSVELGKRPSEEEMSCVTLSTGYRLGACTTDAVIQQVQNWSIVG